MEINEDCGTTAWDICISLMESGLLAKPTHGTIIRLSPPLVIDDDQAAEMLRILRKVFLAL